jgi:phosphate-selective porin
MNWYPNNNIRFMANYITVLDGDDAELGTTTGDADDADFFLMRAQWHF